MESGGCHGLASSQAVSWGVWIAREDAVSRPGLPGTVKPGYPEGEMKEMNMSGHGTGSGRGQQQSRVVIKDMTQYAPQEIRWLEDGRIAMGKLTLIAGDPGLGKSFMTLELAARVSRGEVGRRANGASGRAVMMSAEDDAGDTLVPRLNAMCARMNRVHFLEGIRGVSPNALDLPQLDRDTDRLIEAIESIGDVSLIVIDPISAYMGKADSHNNAEVRSVLAQLAYLAQVTGAAVVCVTHLNKDSSGKRAVYRAMGSLAFTAAARTVHLVTKHPKANDQSYAATHDEHVGMKRVVSMVKNNLGPILGARVYVIVDGALVWLDETVGGDADGHGASGDGDGVDGFGGDGFGGSGFGVDGEGGVFEVRETKEDQASVFLERLLSGGARAAKEVFERGAAQGHSKNTLERAKGTMSVVSLKRGKIWYWSRDGKDESQLLRDAIEPTPDEAGPEAGHESGQGVSYGDNGFL